MEKCGRDIQVVIRVNESDKKKLDYMLKVSQKSLPVFFSMLINSQYDEMNGNEKIAEVFNQLKIVEDNLKALGDIIEK